MVRRGTLWSSTGNALDVASLGVALMRASGIPAKYCRGDAVPEPGAVAHRFDVPAIVSDGRHHPHRHTDLRPGGRSAAPLGDRGPLLVPVQYWQRLPGCRSAHARSDHRPDLHDPPWGLSAKSPRICAQTTEITLTAEIYSQAGALFGLGSGDGLSSTTVLDQTFNDVDLVGRTLTIGNLVSTTPLSAVVFSGQTTTYTPYIIVGGDSFDPSQDETITGTPYQDVEINFPLSSQVVTGLFLEVNLSSPGSSVQTYDRTLADRLGTAASASGDGSVSVDPNGPPLVSPLDLTTLSITASQYSQAALNSQIPVLAAMQQQLINYQSQVASTPAGTELDALDGQADDELTDSFVAMARSRLAEFDILSDSVTNSIEAASGVLAYLASPRITILSSTATVAQDGSSTLQFSLDLRDDDIQAIALPGNTVATTIAFNIARGFGESEIEAEALGTPPQLTGTSLQVVGARRLDDLRGCTGAVDSVRRALFRESVGPGYSGHPGGRPGPHHRRPDARQDRDRPQLHRPGRRTADDRLVRNGSEYGCNGRRPGERTASSSGGIHRGEVCLGEREQGRRVRTGGDHGTRGEDVSKHRPVHFQGGRE